MKNTLFVSWPIVFLVVALGLTVFAWWQSTSLEQFSIERTQEELQSRARLFLLETTRLIQEKDLSALHGFFRKEGKATGTRITLIDNTGKVIADSDENPANMDNHRQRPEITEAIQAFDQGETSFSTIRHSATSGQRMIYCAMPLEVDGKPYVLRTAFSIHEIDRIVRKARIDVVWAVVVTILIAAGIGYFLFQTVTRPIRALRSASAKIAAGDLDAKLPVPEHGVIRELGNSVSRMAEELKARIDEISREKNERDAIFAALSEGVVVLDAAGIIIDTNRAARRIFQINGDPRNRQAAALLRNEALDDFLKQLRKTGNPAEGSRLGQLAEHGFHQGRSPAPGFQHQDFSLQIRPERRARQF